jgi:hypothetical protein
MKVYLATRGEYSDYRVCHAFAKREDAEAYPLGDDVKELEVRDGPVEVRTWHTLQWNPAVPDRDASSPFASNPAVYSERRDFDGDEGAVLHEWRKVPLALFVRGWDRDRVLKIYGEQRAAYIARREGVS